MTKDKLVIDDTQSSENRDLVSIIMPNYNGSKYLRETIDSVISQTYTNWELLFVDDCSTDDSLDIVRSYGDQRIKILQNEQNSGAAVSRNRAIEAASGRWIAFLDSDDIWHCEKLSRHLEFMVERNSKFSFTHYYVVDENGAQTAQFCPRLDKYDYNTILKHCYIGCSTVIYDREALGTFFMPEDAVKREDFACWLRILRTGVCADCLEEALTSYKIHGNSVSSNKIKMIKYQWNVYRRVEKLSFIKSVYYMVHWAIKGVLKYR